MYITRDHKGSHQFSINNLDHFDVVPVTIVGLLRRNEHVLISAVIPRKLEEHRLHFRPVHLVQVHVQLVEGPERRFAHFPEGQDEAGQRAVGSSFVKVGGFYDWAWLIPQICQLMFLY